VLDVYPYYKDREQYASMARRAREELHAMFERDFVALRADRDEDDDRGDAERPS
jgi:glutathione-regulated potassium-efflux system ancillary protein KefC